MLLQYENFKWEVSFVHHKRTVSSVRTVRYTSCRILFPAVEKTFLCWRLKEGILFPHPNDNKEFYTQIPCLHDQHGSQGSRMGWISRSIRRCRLNRIRWYKKYRDALFLCCRIRVFEVTRDYLEYFRGCGQECKKKNKKNEIRKRFLFKKCTFRNLSTK